MNSTAVSTTKPKSPLALAYGLTDDQFTLIRDTVAPKATADELRLFLYRCQQLGLDPLKPGEIFFIKYEQSPGTIVIGIEGFRKRAGRTGKLSGINRGVLRDENGKCIGAWCEVHRSDWTHPAREEVSLAEYNTQKAMWLKMPETMIKKVAEAAALRMAFPDELGGVYATEEMDQAARGNPDHKMATTQAKDSYQPTDIADGTRPVRDASPLAAPGKFELKYGSLAGRLVETCSADELHRWLEEMMNMAHAKGREITPGGPVAEAFANVEAYLEETGAAFED